MQVEQQRSKMILPKSGLVRIMGNALMKAMPANLRSGLRSMTAATLGKVMNLTELG